jgi:pseudaminic acid cytidylyltransferase
VPRIKTFNYFMPSMNVWSIDAACRAGVYVRIFVSNDGKEISAIAQKYGADVPSMRPTE